MVSALLSVSRYISSSSISMCSVTCPVSLLSSPVLSPASSFLQDLAPNPGTYTKIIKPLQLLKIPASWLHHHLHQNLLSKMLGGGGGVEVAQLLLQIPLSMDEWVSMKKHALTALLSLPTRSPIPLGYVPMKYLYQAEAISDLPLAPLSFFGPSSPVISLSPHPTPFSSFLPPMTQLLSGDSQYLLMLFPEPQYCCWFFLTIHLSRAKTFGYQEGLASQCRHFTESK